MARSVATNTPSLVGYKGQKMLLVGLREGECTVVVVRCRKKSRPIVTYTVCNLEPVKITVLVRFNGRGVQYVQYNIVLEKE